MYNTFRGASAAISLSGVSPSLASALFSLLARFILATMSVSGMAVCLTLVSVWDNEGMLCF